MRSSSNNHSDTATRATEEQNEWYEPYAIRSKPTRSQLRRTQASRSKTTIFCSLGYHDAQHGNARDSTNDETQQPQHTRRFDTCMSCQNPNHTRWRGSCVQKTRSTGQQIGISIQAHQAVKLSSHVCEVCFLMFHCSVFSGIVCHCSVFRNCLHFRYVASQLGCGPIS